MAEKTPLKFKVGDDVQSAPDSCDVTGMKATWVAVIHEVKGENDSGGCYDTLGFWLPIKDKAGKVSDLWADHKFSDTPTLRQLWGDHLVKA